MTFVFPGVKSVGWVEADKLSPDMRMKAAAGVPVSVMTDIHSISIRPGASLKRTASLSNGGDYEEAELEFVTSDCFPLVRRTAFVAETADGDLYLIGAKEKPFPTITISYSAGRDDGERAAFSVKVSLKGTKSLLKIG